MNQIGKNNHNWKGGRRISQAGYVYVLKPDHPNANSTGYIFEHRLIMELKLGRFLNDFEFVHHINGIKSDNRIENLIILTRSQHNKIHHKLEKNQYARKYNKVCKIEDCNLPTRRYGFCEKHSLATKSERARKIYRSKKYK